MNEQTMELIKARSTADAGDVTAENVQDDQSIIARAAAVFKAGGLVIFPTETVYGIGAAAQSDMGYEALRHAKGRPQTQPFTVHAGSHDDVLRLVDPASVETRRLIRKALPGPVTIIVEVAEKIARERIAHLGLAGEVVDRIYSQGTVGLRYPDHDLACGILRSAQGPVLASSANLHGQPPARDITEAVEALGDKAMLAIDGGHTRYAKGSTIIRVSGRAPRVKMTIERHGVYDERFVRKLMRWTILFVCSGNTCRSPMAAALTRAMLAKERSIGEDDLLNAGLQVISAGTSVVPGYPAAPEAVQVVKEMGGDLSTHRSVQLDKELVREADVIYCMTQQHYQEVVALAPEAAGRTFVLDPTGDIVDPIGLSLTVYRRTAEAILANVRNRLKEESP